MLRDVHRAMGGRGEREGGRDRGEGKGGRQGERERAGRKYIESVCSSISSQRPLHLTGVTKALRNMNKRLNLPQLQKIMMQFEKESEIMDLKEELISDTIDDVIGEDDEEDVRM